MTPSARLSAAIELLDSLFNAWKGENRIPADKLIDSYFKARRYIGSHDRGAISEFVYWIIRHKASLDWWCARQPIPATPRSLALAATLLRGDATANRLAMLFGESKYAPLPLTDREWQFAHHLSRQEGLAHSAMPQAVQLNYPQWMEPMLVESFGKNLPKEMAAMQEQAGVDLRTNTLRITREELMQKLAAEGFEPEACALSPAGIRLKKRGAVFASPLFKQGCFEMQDEGSQVVANLVDAQPGQKVIDFCAGAGGKTLAIASQMENKGRILALDTSAKRLAQLPMRLKRAGVFNTEWRVISSESDQFLKRHKQTADRVLIDVPCSGSGTWRRNPDLKWRMEKKDLDEVLAVQARILESASRLVKVGGRLIYATCSILTSENEKQIENFLVDKTNFRVVCAQKIWNKTSPSDATDSVSYLWLTPHQDGVDGFFAAVLERVSA